MTLEAGARLGPYEILGALGAGGMGEVYKARDTRLDRIVAIKVLPPHVLSDPALRARFEREARTVSSLDHPNICILHDVGREGDVEYIVMQYLEGETLAARLARGPLPLDEALRYGTELAAALDKAHRAGVLHRDLKPGNVILSKSAGRDSSARLLDFGLAKIVATDVISGADTVLATSTSPLTGRGTIVGTLQYMSPEQLEGRDVDARSDIFSFGALLYEMVTGRRAFEGSSQASIIGAILEREPTPIAVLAPLTPPALDRLVRKCLAKDRDRRWQSAADLCDELSWIAQSSGVQSQPAAVAVQTFRPAPIWGVLAAVAVIAAAALLAWKWLPRKEPVDTLARRLSITMPDGIHLAAGGIAVSPDGRSIVIAASLEADPAPSLRRGDQVATRLYVRPFSSTAATVIAGTDGARAPFFSADSQSIGYFTDGAVWKVSLRGGPPERLYGMPPVSRGAVWIPDGSLIVAPTQSSEFQRLKPDGTTEPFTILDQSHGEKGHLWPQLLPGGEEILFTIRRGTATNIDDSDVALLNVATRKWRVVVKGAAFGQYSPTGHLLFVRSGTLSAVPFDLAKKETAGSAQPIVERLAVDADIGGAHYAVAPDGTLLFLTGTFGERRGSAVWVDRSGKVSPAAMAAPPPRSPQISPDGKRVVFSGMSPDGDSEVYVGDLARGTAVRLSNDPADDFNSIWTADGRRVIWSSLTAGRLPFLVMRSADGSGQTSEIGGEGVRFVGSASKDGVLAFTQVSLAGASDIFTLPLDGTSKGKPFIATTATEYGPEFSPDGKWLAFMSNESGTDDVYVVPYPGPGAKRRVSPGGGLSPAWSRDGRELFFQTAEGMMAVDVVAGQEIEFGPPRLLFKGDFVIDSAADGPSNFDVSPDGKRFLMLQRRTFAAPLLSFQVMLNWVADLTKR